jgi:hypothetical protein
MSGLGLRNGGKRLLIVGDTPQFGRTISLILDDAQNQKWTIRHTTYEGFRGMLSLRLFQETDLFVLDLWRTYPTGIRAEGIAVAEQLARQHAKSLVVSPLSIGRGQDAPGYWDMASSTSLIQHCDMLLRDKRRKPQALPENLKSVLRHFLEAPSGHREI